MRDVNKFCYQSENTSRELHRARRANRRGGAEPDVVLGFPLAVHVLDVVGVKTAGRRVRRRESGERKHAVLPARCPVPLASSDALAAAEQPLAVVHQLLHVLPRLNLLETNSSDRSAGVATQICRPCSPSGRGRSGGGPDPRRWSSAACAPSPASAPRAPRRPRRFSSRRLADLWHHRAPRCHHARMRSMSWRRLPRLPRRRRLCRPHPRR